jgi:ATP-dependent helicase/nuclease subunit A
LAYGRETESLLRRLPEGSVNTEWLHDQFTTTATPYQRFAKILTENKKAILERLGQEADDAGQEFLTLALDYEQKHGTSLVGFLDWLSRGETEIKREMEANAGLVRLMTVHGSKGLEAPIVFLGDAADPPPQNKSKLLRVTDVGPQRGLVLFEPKMIMTPPIVEKLKADAKTESLNERLRLLYVGMTRAADELYICGSLNKEDDNKVNADSWYPQIKQAIVENIALPALRQVTAEDGFSLTRFGTEPVFVDSVVRSESDMRAVPLWATTALPTPPTIPLRAVPSRNSDAFDKKAVEEGIAIHKLIEMMADCSLPNRQEEGRRWSKRLKLAEGLSDRLHDLLQNSELTVFFGETAQSEVSIGGMQGLQGRIDRMAVQNGCVYLLDYKTNRNPPEFISPDHRYALQMAAYAKLLREAFPGHDVKAALLWTQTGDITWLDLQASDHYL